MRAVFALLVLMWALSPLPADATDCADNFPAGRYGIAQTDSAYASGQLARPGWAPIFLRKRSVPLEPEKGFTDCKWVYPFDVFRLVYEQQPQLLLAGCSGDFDGDGAADYALLMQQQSTVESVVFLNRGTEYQAVSLGVPFDRYGFDEDRSIWPGPFCLDQPENHRLAGFGDPAGVEVFGDLITVGWQTHYWNPESRTFQMVWTSD